MKNEFIAIQRLQDDVTCYLLNMRLCIYVQIRL